MMDEREDIAGILPHNIALIATARFFEELSRLEEMAGGLVHGRICDQIGHSAGSLKSLHEFSISSSSFEEYALYGKKGGEPL
jgi:hypothetical protein